MKKFCVIGGLLVTIAICDGCRKTRTVLPPKAIPIRADGRIELNLATFNIRYENNEDLNERSWRQRLALAVRLIRRVNPDVMGMQEVIHGQAADLWVSLPDYEFFGKGRDDGAKEGEYAGIFYRADRFQRDESEGGTFWLSGTPETPGSMTWGNTLPRIATWTRLIDRSTNRGFYIFNTHLDHKHQGSREEAALLLSRRIDARKHADEPVILTGDFNSQETNPAIAYLGGKSVPIEGKLQTWQHGLLDTLQIAHPGEKFPQSLNFFGVKAGWRIDYVLVSKGAKITAAAVEPDIQPYASDHFPVSAHVIFP